MKKKGFTLIELMIVVAIIGILAMIAIPNFIKFQCRAKQSEAKANLQTYRVAQLSYFAEYDEFGDVATIGFDPDGTRYIYCTTADDCLPCTGNCGGLTMAEAKAACAKAGALFRPTGEDAGFLGCAAGRLHKGGRIDTWTIAREGQLTLVNNACAP